MCTGRNPHHRNHVTSLDTHDFYGRLNNILPLVGSTLSFVECLEIILLMLTVDDIHLMSCPVLWCSDEFFSSVVIYCLTTYACLPYKEFIASGRVSVCHTLTSPLPGLGGGV
jgi:hypothetical protein